MTQTSPRDASSATSAAPARWFAQARAFLAGRPAIGKAMVTVLVLNEIRGIVVVIAVLACWKARHG